MHEIIIKVLEKTPEEIKELSADVAVFMEEKHGDLKAATKGDEYSNEIWQIGKKTIDIRHFKTE